MNKRTPEAWIWLESAKSGGHIRDAESLAQALRAKGIKVKLLAGIETLETAKTFNFKGVELVALPNPKVGNQIDVAAQKQRIETICGLYDKTHPKPAFISELWPTGRESFDTELSTVLTHIKQSEHSSPTYALARDYPTRALVESVPLLDSLFTRTLVRSDNTLVYASVSNVQYCGYYTGVLPERKAMPNNEREIFVSLGGKFNSGLEAEFKEKILTSVIRASGSPHLQNIPICILVSADCPEPIRAELHNLAKRAGNGRIRFVEAYDSKEHDKAVVNARLLITTGGFTLFEGAHAGTPTIAVPMPPEVQRGEEEQLFRTKVLAQKGLVTHVTPDTLDSTEELAKILADKLQEVQRVNSDTNFDGAERSARIIAEDLSHFLSIATDRLGKRQGHHPQR